MARFPLYDGFNRPKNRGMTWPEWRRERLISLVCRHLVDQSPLIVPTDTLAPEVAFLKKPFTLDVLARKVREVLDRL